VRPLVVSAHVEDLGTGLSSHLVEVRDRVRAQEHARGQLLQLACGHTHRPVDPNSHQLPLASFAGLVVGFLTGFLGVGGGSSSCPPSS